VAVGGVLLRGAAVKPEETRQEIKRLEDERLRLAPEVMGGDRDALERDRDLERRIMGLASAEREGRADELREAWRRRHPGGDE
jgi:hypothetical protein